jgi:hypothetical protein
LFIIYKVITTTTDLDPYLIDKFQKYTGILFSSLQVCAENVLSLESQSFTGLDWYQKHLLTPGIGRSIDELQKSYLTAFSIVSTSDTNGHQSQKRRWHALATKK